MKEDISTTETVPSDTARLGGATRFALTCVVLGFSYLSIRGCLVIPNFQVIFQDMLGSETSLPWITKFVLSCRLVFLAVSIGIPVLGIALLFSRDIARSLYFLGAAMLVIVVECIVLYHALSAPLMNIITKMQESAL